MEARHAGELERERVRLDSVMRENEQLRLFLAEHRKSSTAGMSALQQQLESHISRLQQHTTELRGDLGRSSSPGVDSPSAGRQGSDTAADFAVFPGSSAPAGAALPCHAPLLPGHRPLAPAMPSEAALAEAMLGAQARAPHGVAGKLLPGPHVNLGTGRKFGANPPQHTYT